MNDKMYREFVHDSIDQLVELNNSCKARFGISSYTRWDCHQNSRQLVFSSEGVPRVIAQIQIVGSYSHKARSWMWAWANESIIPPLTRSACKVREFGERQGVARLAKECWRATESDGWEMTAITAVLTDAKGAYRCPMDQRGILFVVFESIALATRTARSSG